MGFEMKVTEFDTNIQEIIHSFAEQFARVRFKDLDPRLNALVPPEVKKRQLQCTAETELVTYLHHIVQGLKEVISVMERVATLEPELFTENVKEELTNFCNNEVAFEKIALESLVNNSEQNSMQEQLKITDATMQGLYRIGVEYYNTKSYAEAANIYIILALLNPTVADYWLNLGDAEYYNQAFTNALYAYAMAALTDPTDPVPHYYAARCYEELKQYDFACNSLDILLVVIDEHPEKDAWIEKVQAFKSHLQELIDTKV